VAAMVMARAEEEPGQGNVVVEETAEAAKVGWTATGVREGAETEGATVAERAGPERGNAETEGATVAVQRAVVERGEAETDQVTVAVNRVVVERGEDETDEATVAVKRVAVARAGAEMEGATVAVQRAALERVEAETEGATVAVQRAAVDSAAVQRAAVETVEEREREEIKVVEKAAATQQVARAPVGENELALRAVARAEGRDVGAREVVVKVTAVTVTMVRVGETEQAAKKEERKVVCQTEMLKVGTVGQSRHICCRNSSPPADSSCHTAAAPATHIPSASPQMSWE